MQFFITLTFLIRLANKNLNDKNKQKKIQKNDKTHEMEYNQNKVKQSIYFLRRAKNSIVSESTFVSVPMWMAKKMLLT